MRLHHIGIVVKNIQESLGEISKYIKFEEPTIPTLVESQKVNVCFLKIGSINLELIEPAEKDSPISSFLSNGGGFHHLCFEVDDIYKKINELEKNGAQLIVKPTLGFENRLISFLHLNMKNTNCNLIELVTKNDRK